MGCLSFLNFWMWCAFHLHPFASFSGESFNKASATRNDLKTNNNKQNEPSRVCLCVLLSLTRLLNCVKCVKAPALFPLPSPPPRVSVCVWVCECVVQWRHHLPKSDRPVTRFSGSSPLFGGFFWAVYFVFNVMASSITAVLARCCLTSSAAKILWRFSKNCCSFFCLFVFISVYYCDFFFSFFGFSLCNGAPWRHSKMAWADYDVIN